MILDEYLTAREIQAAEYNANYLGVSNLLLMESAGEAVANVIAAKVKTGGLVLVACGLGGNGGDGFVAARHLADRGYRVKVILVGNPNTIRSEETRHNFEVAQLMTGSLELKIVEDSTQVEPIEAHAVVDALIGYTYHGGLSPVNKAVIKAINASSAYTVSIDTPTGLVVDTGEAPEECVEADVTVTFHKPKTGFKGKPKQMGKLIVAKLGLPFEAELFTGPGDVLLVNKRREAESHKGMFGRLLVVGGSETYHGAPALASMGAHATGIDLVYTAVPESAADGVSVISPSMIVVKMKGKRLTPMNIAQLRPFIDKVDAVAVGPGLGLDDDTKKAALQLIKEVETRKLPLIVDADALKAFGEKRRKLKVPAVFTPHSREFEVLTGRKAEGDWREKGAIVEEEAKRLGSIILLKGAVDIISDGFHTRYNWTGNPGMTVGGTGDVLTGISSGYIAQGVEPMQAACAGAFINGAAGDAVYAEKGYHILPEDVVQFIPYIVEDALDGKMRLV
ncbi:MAG: NAD(P)H-hydrate dehydratase [Candidatus Bathyarchaeia archaeon]|jgi:NAD(P)H-hydrate epimerase